MQNRKTIFLKKKSSKNNSRKNFFKKTPVDQSINGKYQSYEYLQIRFSKSSFLIHFEAIKSIFIDVNALKKKDFEVMIFHVQNDSEKNDIIIIKNEIQSIMFFSKILIDAKSKYWLIELKMIGVIWVVKKIRHIIESCRKSSVIIFIDHAAIADLIKQIFLTTFNTDKLNLCFVWAFQFLSALSIRIKIKSEKFHVIFDALFCFKTNSDSKKNSNSLKKNNKSIMFGNLNDVKKFFAHVKRLRHQSLQNVWFHYVNEMLNAHFDGKKTLLKMNDDFKKTLKKIYETDFQWTKIRDKIRLKKNSNDVFDDMNFIFKKNRLYYVSSKKILRFCISWNMKKNVFQIIHDQNHHCEFHRMYVRAIDAVYIKHFAIWFKRYIWYCKQCLKKQTTKHVLYEQLILIKIMTLFFHTITIDFIVTLSSFESKMNAVFITINKYFKWIIMLSEMTTWSTFQWAVSWFKSFQKKEWNLFQTILFDRNRKFVVAFWKIIFSYLKTVLLFIIVYHFQKNDQLKQINQILKIALKFALMKKKCKNFIKLLFFVQIMMNNFQNIIIDFSSHKILYDFKMLKTMNLLNNEQTRKRIENENSPTTMKNKKNMLWKKVSDAINFAQTMQKICYDSKHKKLILKKKTKCFWNYIKNIRNQI